MERTTSPVPAIETATREELETFPNLRMNISEAARFWGLDLATCWRVLTELRVIGVVSTDPDCRYYALDGVRS